ncbi:MAG: methyl-accepting chemotaxis protein [bacterium]|nr:methyl-accepting chemotaxis protein [bacterium]
MKINEMTVKARVLIGFALLLALGIGLGLYNLLGYGAIGTSVRNIEYSKFFGTLENQHRRWNNGLAKIFLDSRVKELTIQLDHTKCRMGQFIYGDEAKEFAQHFPELAPLIQKLEPVHKDLHSSAKEIAPLWFAGDPAKAEEARQIYQDRTLKNLDQTASILGEMSDKLDAVAKGAAENLASTIADRQVISGVLLVLMLVAGLVLSYWIATSIGLALASLMGRLDQSAESLNQASDEISGNSQQVAQGASEQAASLEETSSAMEQLAAQSKENSSAADRTAEAVVRIRTALTQATANAEEAFKISAASREGAQKGVEAMEKISGSMKAVDEASQQVLDIIDLIDEITRETKMLATNAAIEAARAGEQGKGFAVVADEVSKLAENSKAAAKQINDLVKGNAAKAVAGREMAGLGDKQLREIYDSSKKTEDLVQGISKQTVQLSREADDLADLAEQITRTSNQQSQGTQEVSRAILEMDQVTQGNASAAEEAASAAEALSTQARQLVGIVADLGKLVGQSQAVRDVNKQPHRNPKNYDLSDSVEAEALPHSGNQRKRLPRSNDFGDF